MSQIKTLLEQLDDRAPPLRMVYGDAKQPVPKDLLEDTQDIPVEPVG